MGTQSRKIIVLDDSEICRETVRLALEARGHEVIALDTPFGLTAMMNEVRPDLVLLDVMMPALNGDRVADVVLRNGRHFCPIVFLSDRPHYVLRSLVETTGAAGYIQKTEDLAQLADAAEEYFLE
jgi:DNA-binding response OmpR family regulator